jgi:response regulator RpfG family c-di-GMP phosphodiesterase
MDKAAEQKRKRILLVDDSPFYLAQLRDLLATMGYDTVVCNRPREGEELLEREHEEIDLLLVDLKMPDIDGFAFLRWLRSRPWGARVPVLVLTGAYELGEVVRPLRELGVLGLVDKGAHPHTLLARINTALHPEVLQLRRYERVACAIPVTFTWGAFRKDATLAHLSLGGCFLITLEEIPVEASVEVEARLPGATRMHRILGRVVWRMGGEEWSRANASIKGVGVQWKDPDRDALSDLERYIEQRKEEDRLFDLIGP